MKKIKVGGFVMVKHSCSLASQLSSHKTFKVSDIQGRWVKVEGKEFYVPIETLEAY